MNIQNPKHEILVFTEYYLPGQNAGGPIKTLSSLVEHIGDEFAFRIVTRDRDLKSTKPYHANNKGSWYSVGKCKVLYLKPNQLSFRKFYWLMSDKRYDIIYLNSLFSPHFSIKPLLIRRIGLIKDKIFILAPRGELSTSALSLKILKKRIFLLIARILKLYDGLKWQASSIHEAADIKKVFGKSIFLKVTPLLINIVPDLSTFSEGQPRHSGKLKKKPHSLNIVFLSRIARMKNLDGALRMLKDLKSDVSLDIFGPIEDEKYWADCIKIISLLPQNTKVEYKGSINHGEVSQVLANYHLFLLPTLGENFGHVILEALFAGCPVLISDRTPWRNLEERGVGWDVPLERPEQFTKILQECILMDDDEFCGMSKSAIRYAEDVAKDPKTVKKNRELFKNIQR